MTYEVFPGYDEILTDGEYKLNFNAVYPMLANVFTLSILNFFLKSKYLSLL